MYQIRQVDEKKSVQTTKKNANKSYCIGYLYIKKDPEQLNTYRVFLKKKLRAYFSNWAIFSCPLPLAIS